MSALRAARPSLTLIFALFARPLRHYQISEHTLYR
jgi:hypothetical protein